MIARYMPQAAFQTLDTGQIDDLPVLVMYSGNYGDLVSEGETPEDKLVLFRGIDKVKFRRPVVPGDQLNLHVKLLKHRRNFWTFAGRAVVDGETATEAEISAVVMSREEGGNL